MADIGFGLGVVVLEVVLLEVVLLDPHCDVAVASVAPLFSLLILVNVPGRITKARRRIQVKNFARRV